MSRPKDDVQDQKIKKLLEYGKYDEAIFEINESTTPGDRYNTNMEYAFFCIEIGDYNKASSLVNILKSDKEIYNDPSFHNMIEIYSGRIIDHELFSNMLKNELDKERYKTIEILGIFVAIVSFIFSSVSIGNNINSIDGLNFLKIISSSLLVFIIILSIFLYYFTNNNSFVSKNNEYFKILFFVVLVLIFLVNAFFLFKI